jgi:predicted RNA binding protein YcfA (HicA-like mRNA interferase family)|tara:strand:- start:1016 stop:1225 length:210 start_codon:yes stop_codon:yes gene_type:complete
MNSNDHRTVRRWMKELGRLGWRFTSSRKGSHVIALAPDGSARIALAAGNGRNTTNTVQHFKRLGISLRS